MLSFNVTNLRLGSQRIETRQQALAVIAELSHDIKLLRAFAHTLHDERDEQPEQPHKLKTSKVG